jgi:hypothetical protein
MRLQRQLGLHKSENFSGARNECKDTFFVSKDKLIAGTGGRQRRILNCNTMREVARPRQDFHARMPSRGALRLRPVGAWTWRSPMDGQIYVEPISHQSPGRPAGAQSTAIFRSQPDEAPSEFRRF